MVTVTEMKKYGYTYTGMKPLTLEQALKVYDKEEEEIFLLYSDNSETLVESKTDMINHSRRGGFLGIEKPLHVIAAEEKKRKEAAAKRKANATKKKTPVVKKTTARKSPTKSATTRKPTTRK